MEKEKKKTTTIRVPLELRIYLETLADRWRQPMAEIIMERFKKLEEYEELDRQGKLSASGYGLAEIMENWDRCLVAFRS
jgi:hypothetical protein